MPRPPRLALVVLLLALAATARAETVVVFAAASLRESLDAAARAFESASGHKVVVSYAASNALARQVESGAPADLFISADTDWIDYVERRGLAIPGSRRNLLANELVLVAPASSGFSSRANDEAGIRAALGNKRIAIANPQAVPAGRYARAAFTSLGTWGSISDKVAATESVRTALALVARGEAPLGVVYRTDALAEKRVRVVDTFPPASHPPIVYPVVTLKRSTTTAAAALVSFLAAAEGRAIFARFGFRAP